MDFFGVGLYAMVPYSGFAGASAFYVDEREQYFSNSLHPELYSDRMTAASVAFGVGPYAWYDTIAPSAGVRFRRDAVRADVTNVNGGADVSVESAPTADALPQQGDGDCQPAFTSAICDPVCNTNCPALQRCDVSNTPRTGVCIGIWISREGATCVGTATTDPCASMLTCVNGMCRRLCYGDADCTTAGTCCNSSIDLNGAPSGFRTCSLCGP